MSAQSNMPNIEEIRLNAQIEVYKYVAESSAYFLDSKLAEKVGSFELQPLDLAVISGAELPVIQSLYASDPDRLQEHTLELASEWEEIFKYLAKLKPEKVSPKALGTAFNELELDAMIDVARQCPEIASMQCDIENDDTENYLISRTMSANAPEEDIRTLVELWPESVVTGMHWHHNDRLGAITWSTPLQQCLRKGYSKGLFDFMMIQTNIEDWPYPYEMPDYALNNNDLVWIEAVLKDHTGSVTFADFDTSCLEWSGPGYQDFLGLFFLNDNKIRSLRLRLPDYMEDNQVAVSMVEFAKKHSLKMTSTTRIEELSLHFPHSAYCELLNCLPHLPHLQKLHVNVGDHLDSSMPIICQLIEQGRLWNLSIQATARAMTSRKRKGLSEDTVMVLKPVFDVLAANTTLTMLSLLGSATDNERHRADVIRELTEILKQNTTLMFVGGPHHSQYDEKRYDSESQLQFMLSLNFCGRKQAQDPATSVDGFVALLGSVQDRVQHHVRLPTTMRRRGAPDPAPVPGVDNTTGLKYGLLRENVSKWISSV